MAKKFNLLDQGMNGKINYRDPETVAGLRETLDLSNEELENL